MEQLINSSIPKDIDVLILGGGLAGSLCAHTLKERGLSVCVVEKEDTVGGLLREIRVADLDVDQGPHYLFHSPKLTRIRTCIERFDRTVDVQPFAWTLPSGNLSDPHHYPISDANRSRLGLMPARSGQGRPASPGETFESRIQSLAGRKVYETYFQNYTHKMWGIQPHLLSGSFVPKKIRFTAEHEPFFGDNISYRPVKGYRHLIDTLMSTVPVLTDTITGARFSGSRIEGIYCRNSGEIRAPWYISTIRPDTLFAQDILSTRALVLAYVAYQPQFSLFPPGNVHWAYLPNNFSFTRVTDMKRACLMPSEAACVLCFEFPATLCADISPAHALSQITSFMKQGLAHPPTPDDFVIHRIQEHTPIPSISNTTLRKHLFQELATKKNLICLGRLGQFQFLWMRDIIASTQKALHRIGVGE